MRDERGSRPVVLALGSNLGDRAGYLDAAVRALDAHDGISVTAVSRYHESIAVTTKGIDHDKPAYLNAVVLAETDLTSVQLLEAVNRIEGEHGRTRDTRWGDRTLDIDIVDYDGERVDLPQLALPHPRAVERDFVLEPWLEVDTDAVLTGHGPVRQLLAALRETERSQ